MCVFAHTQTQKEKNGSVSAKLVCRESPYWPDKVTFYAVELQTQGGGAFGGVLQSSLSSPHLSLPLNSAQFKGTFIGMTAQN